MKEWLTIAEAAALTNRTPAAIYSVKHIESRGAA